MDINIMAYMPDTDSEYQKHKRLLLTCLEAEVSLPKETAEYFGADKPSEYILESKLEIRLIKDVHYSEYNNQTLSGFDIHLKTLPKSIDKIRVFNSW